MVRRLSGTLVKVGLNEVGVEQFRELLAGRRNPRLDVAAWTAPASGLFLESVRY
jgi:tRNA U38,U39,U40 pseudouridine synthase TruA